MPRVNLDVVREQLFVRPKVVDRLCRDYGFSRPLSAQDLGRSIVRAFGQVSATPASSTELSPRSVFRAAVFALASNSRRWSRFLQVEPQVRATLFSYEPSLVAEASGQHRSLDIAPLLGGITAKADSAAVLRWANLLTTVPDYGEQLEQLGLRITSTGLDPKLVPGVAACLLGFGLSFASSDLAAPAGASTWKVPGMGGVLSSEFLRNLHWDTYKPDRHILRLLGLWFPDQMRNAQTEAALIASHLFGKSGTVAREFLAGTLLGISVTPVGTPLAEADNLIWALGAYVEKKGRESAVNYTTD